MKLKNILIEQNDLKKVERVLNSDFRGDLYPQIYRGTTTQVDTFDIREIRKNRLPRSTRYATQGIINAYENNVYTRWPKRSESKFGSPDRVSAGGYGPHEVVVFPDRKADICWIQRDPSTGFFHDSYSALKSIIQSNMFAEFLDVLELNEFDELSRFMYMAEKFMGDRILYEEYKSYLNDNIKELKKEYEKLKNKKTELQYQRGELLKVFRPVEIYFTRLEEGVSEHAYEVIFDGEKYLRINADLFEEKFSWSGKRWKLTT